VRLRLTFAFILVGLLTATPGFGLAAGAQPLVMYDSQQNPPGLWTANLDGSNPQSFYPGGFWSSWSTSGAKIAFTQNSQPCGVDGGVGQIYVMNADNPNLTAVARGCEPRISPDGTKVVYQPGPNAIDVMNASGQGSPITLVDFNQPGSNPGCDSQPTTPNYLADCYSAENPGWLGNGTIIYDGGLGLALWQVPATGGNASMVFGTEQSSSKITWLNGVTGSPDGSTFAAAGSRCNNTTCSSGIFVGEQLVAGDPTGMGATLSDPQWSSDGKQIVYETSLPGPSSSVYTVASGGGASTLVSGTDTTAANPSFAPPAAPGTITGTVFAPDGKTPLPGATVTMTPLSGGQPVTATTQSNGSYTASVSATTYAVSGTGTPPGQQPGGHYHVTSCSGATSSDTSTCTVDVAPAGTSSASFSYGALQLKGTVTFAANDPTSGKPDPVAGMNVTVNGPGGPTTVQTDQNGNYTVNLTQQGSYTVTPDPKYQPAATSSADCQASGGTCTVNMNQDRVANFTVQCLPTLDFHTSMIATGCFQPLDLTAGQWKAVGQFRMDGVDYQSGNDKTEPVTFNTQQKTVDGADVKMSLSAPGWGGGWLAFYIPGGLHLSFPSSSVQHIYALTTPWAVPGNLLVKTGGFLGVANGGSSTVFGFPAHAPAVEFAFTPGQTILTMQLSWPPTSSAFLDPINGLWKRPTPSGGATIAYPWALKAVITAENQDGVSEIDGTLSFGGVMGIDTANNALVVNGSAKPALGTVELAKLGFRWLLAQGGFHGNALLVIHNQVSDAANEWVKPLGGFIGKRLVYVDLGFKWVTAASLFGANFRIPGLTSLGVQVNNINEYIEGTPGLFWQRIGLSGGYDPTTGAVSLGGDAGFTFLPRFKHDLLWFSEIASLDASGTFTFDPFSFTAIADFRIANANIIHGKMKLNHDGLLLQGTAGFDLHQILRVGFPASIQGTGSLSLPTTGDRFLGNWLLQVAGRINVWNLVADARFAISADGAAWCATSDKLGTAGAYFDGAWHVGGCDSGPLGPARAAGVHASADTRELARNTGRSAHAAAEGAFTVRAGSALSEVAIRGAGGAPEVTVSGPRGLSLSATNAGPYDVARGAGLVMNPDDRTTYLLLAHAARGTYTVSAAAGSPAVVALRFARRLPPARVNARIASAGCRRVLKWRLRPEPGQRVVFETTGRSGEHTLLTTAAARGRRVFTPDYGGGAQQLVAFVAQQGTPRAQLTVASFSAPGGTTRVAGLRARRSGTRATLRWAPVCGAGWYLIVVGTGPKATAIQSVATSVRVALGKRHHVRITVRAVNPNGLLGRARTITVD